ncbi:hypothetical protein LguiB_014931 [Lonicera macranthoides]
MDHNRIVRLLEVFHDNNWINLVFEYLHCDLKKFMHTHSTTLDNPSTVKKFVHQILRGVEYCHSRQILHRDLKPQNILIDVHNLNLKLAGFGLARTLSSPLQKYTPEVVTLWYRAPEILLVSPIYSTPIDIWSVGCIFAELVNRKILFKGNSEIDQVFAIFRLLGKPSEETWPGIGTFCSLVLDLKDMDTPKDLADLFPDLELAGVQLLSEMLRLDPTRRITAKEALQHEYFRDLDDFV